MRIFLTGGTGFIGKHVVKKLYKDGHKLLILVNEKAIPDFRLKPSPRLEFIKGDLGKISSWKNKVKKFKPQVAVHLAWDNIKDTGFKTSFKNLIISLNLVNALNEIGCRRIIAAGTQWEYGHDKSGKIKENAPREPYNALAAAKIGIELLGEKMAAENGSQFVWLRFFTVYGPGQRSGALIPSIVNAFKQGKTADVKSIRARHDFIYVGDVARAIAAVIRRCKSQVAIYNIGSGRLTGVREIVKRIQAEFPGSKIILPGKKTVAKSSARIVSGLYADISAIKKDTGWRPKIGIRTGVKKTVSYYKKL